MGDTLVIEFQLEYDGRALTHNETAPHLMAWTSLPCRTKSFEPLLWRDAAKLYSKPTTVRLHVPLRPDCDNDNAPTVSYDAKKQTFTLPLDTTIGIQARVDTPNDEGRITIRGCGEALLPLGIELEAVRNDAKRLRERRFELALVYHTHQRKDGSAIEKGRATLTGLHAYLLPLTNGAERVEVALRSDGVAGDYSYLHRNLQFFNSEYQQMLERSVAMFVEEARAKGFDLAPSSDEERRVHAPTFSTPAGPQPGFAFVLAPLRASIVPKRGTPAYDKVRRWMRSVATYALQRENMSESAFVRCVTKQNARTGYVYDNAYTLCCGVFGQMLAIPPTSTPYIGDFIIDSASLDRVNRTRIAASVASPISSGVAGASAASATKQASIHRPFEAANCEAKLNRWQPPSANGCVRHLPILSADEQLQRAMLIGKASGAASAMIYVAQGEAFDDKKLRVAVEAFNELVDYLSGDCEDLGCFAMRYCSSYFPSYRWVGREAHTDPRQGAALTRGLLCDAAKCRFWACRQIRPEFPRVGRTHSNVWKG